MYFSYSSGLTHPSTRTGAIKPRQPVMSNVRPLNSHVSRIPILARFLDLQPLGEALLPLHPRENRVLVLGDAARD
jgi:hypothetical protein